MRQAKRPYVETTHIALFKGKKIRKRLQKGEWCFSVVDACEVLADSIDAGAYWRKLKQRLTEEGSEVVTFCHGLKLEASDGKFYKTDVANTETLLRLIQSVPSPKAEPLKLWLAKVQEPKYHFADAGTLIETGKGAVRQIEDRRIQCI